MTLKTELTEYEDFVNQPDGLNYYIEPSLMKDYKFARFARTKAILRNAKLAYFENVHSKLIFLAIMTAPAAIVVSAYITITTLLGN